MTLTYSWWGPRTARKSTRPPRRWNDDTDPLMRQIKAHPRIEVALTPLALSP